MIKIGIMLYTTKVSDKGQITIPAKLRKSLNLSEGSKLMLADVGGSLFFQPFSSESKKQVMDLFGSIKPKGKSTNPAIAINKAKKMKALESEI